MAKTNKIGYVICVAIIATGIALILAGMNPFRASYLIVFGVFLLLQKYYDYQDKSTAETPKGLRFWWEKVLSTILCVVETLSFCNFLLSTSTDDIRDVFVWLSACIIGGILFGTFGYFTHTVECSVEEFEAKKKQYQEFGEQYDKIVEEMKSEKNS